MMDHRNRVEILTAILTGSSEDCGVAIVEVMYLSSLSYKHAKEYLTILTDHKLIEYDKRNYSYKTNKKGLKFLDSIRKVTDMLKRTEEQFDSGNLTSTSILD